MGETVYTLYPVFKMTEHGRRRLEAMEDAAVAEEVEGLFASLGEVTVRGTYSTLGFRADAEVMLWLVGPNPESLQEALVSFRRTALGGALALAWSFMGVVKPAEFTPDHQPAFVRGEPPRRYLNVYPFVRSPEWYLLPREQRAELLREHGEVGRRYPDVLANTTSGFGLGDWEWILAFEADELDRIVDCIRALRETQARRFVKEEVPFVTGVRKDLRGILADLC